MKARIWTWSRSWTLALTMGIAGLLLGCTDSGGRSNGEGGADTSDIGASDTGTSDTGTSDTGEGGDTGTSDTGEGGDTGTSDTGEGGDTGASDTGEGGDTVTGIEATCENYCTTVMENCTGDNAQFSSQAECLDYCQNVAGWDAGESGAAAGNTIACRIYHGGDPAKGAPETHCVHAGPSGGDTCGSWCDNYCQLAQHNCTDANEIYDDVDECMDACEGIPATGSAGDTQYDTVQCRIYHLGAPAAGMPGTHCGHGAPDATDFCVGQPTDFQFETALPGDYEQIDRSGMPAVSTVLVTSKVAYNEASPADDLAFTFVGELVTNLTALHDALDDDVEDAKLVPCSMEDKNSDTLPDCAGQTVAPGVRVIDLVIPDTLTIVPASPAGFPNGRRLADPVIDVTLAVILLDLTQHDATALVGLNPTANDLGVEGAFLSTFPYLHPPHPPK